MSNDERLDELERQIHEAIRFHREQYEKAIEPLVDQLVQIRSLRPQVLAPSQRHSLLNEAVRLITDDSLTPKERAEKAVALLHQCE